jgi:beta-lactamase regulating signal transducer with metallopeptidase domain
MAADALDVLMQLNLALAGAVLLVLALRRSMRVWFGVRVTYTLWWIVPASLVATTLPARTIEIVTAVTVPHTLAARSTAAGVEPSVQLPTLEFIDVSSVLGLWLVGVAVMLAVLTVRQRAFVASLGQLSRNEDGTLRAEASGVGPAILGALRPKLVLPKDFEMRFDPAERELVLAHERVHLQRGDARINALVALAQCVCWFNPLVHVAALAMRIDQELACDAAVARRYPKARRIYAEAMLKTQLAPMSLPVGCQWPARGTHPLKLRITMLKRDLPGARRIASGSLLVALVCLITACGVWGAQPPREIEATVRSIAPTQTAINAQLVRAARAGNFQLAAAAIAAGADVNARSSRGMTVLVIAARAEDMRILNLLLNHGADVDALAPGEGNALVAAARRGHVHAVAALVGRGAQVNAIVREYGTPLAASVRTGQLPVARYLVEHGADANLPSPSPAPWDRWGGMRTPLDIAVGGDHAATAAYLRSMGAEQRRVAAH